VHPTSETSRLTPTVLHAGGRFALACSLEAAAEAAAAKQRRLMPAASGRIHKLPISTTVI